jgi:hypothetical protein
MVEQLSTIDFLPVISQSVFPVLASERLPKDITRYSLSGFWNENLSGTMNGLLTSAKTVLSARICVISPGLLAICALRIVLSAYTRCVSFFRTCITFPKLPFPITLSRSNASMVSSSLRSCLKSILRWKEPEPLVAVYHWSVACWCEK